MTQGVSSQGADSLQLGTGPLSRIQGPHPRAQLSFCRAQGPPSRCAVSLLLGKGLFPGYRVPSPEHRSPPPRHTIPLPGRSLLSDGHRFPSLESRVLSAGTTSGPRGARSARRGAAHPTRTRRLQERTDEPSWAQPPPAAQRIQGDRGPPSARRPGCASDPAARRPRPGSIGSGVGGQVHGRRRCAASATCPALT